MPAFLGCPCRSGCTRCPSRSLAYAVLGSRRSSSSAPLSTVAIVFGVACQRLARGDPDEAVAITAALGSRGGDRAAHGGLAARRLGRGVSSKPIVTGFVFGLTLTIVVGEAPTCSASTSRLATSLGALFRTIQHLDQTASAPLWSGAQRSSCWSSGSRAAQVPWGFGTLTLGVVASHLLDLSAKGVATVGEVPAGLPPLGLPMIPPGRPRGVALGAVSLALVALAEGLAAMPACSPRWAAIGFRPNASSSGWGAAFARPARRGGSQWREACRRRRRPRRPGAGARSPASPQRCSSSSSSSPSRRSSPTSRGWVLSAIVIKAVWRFMDVDARAVTAASAVRTSSPQPFARWGRVVRSSQRPWHRDRCRCS